MNVCVCVRARACVRACVRVCVRVKNTYAHVCVLICLLGQFMHTHTHIHSHTHEKVSDIHTHVFASYPHAPASISDVLAYAYSKIDRRTRILKNRQTYTHTHKSTDVYAYSQIDTHMSRCL
jgi:hypothetical protein